MGEYNISFLGTVRDNKKRIFQWIDGANKALGATKQGDCIACWFDLQAVVLFFLSKITFRQRRIIAQNVMLKFNDSFKGKLYKNAYRIAFKSKNFSGTVASRYYGEYLCKELGVDAKLHLVHDPYLGKYDKYYNAFNGPLEKKYDVFMGGNSSRNWKFAFKVAEKLKDVRFCFIMGKAKLESLGIDCSKYPNVTIKTNVHIEEFNGDVYLSKIVMCPVTTEAPAGLIVMYTAASCNTVFMTNDNATYKEYVTEERGEILPLDVDKWKERINYLLADEETRIQKGRNLHEWLLENCSYEACANDLKKSFESM